MCKVKMANMIMFLDYIMKNKLLFVINMKCNASHQNIASIALRKNVQAKEIDLPGGDNKSFLSQTE